MFKYSIRSCTKAILSDREVELLLLSFDNLFAPLVIGESSADGPSQLAS